MVVRMDILMMWRKIPRKIPRRHGRKFHGKRHGGRFHGRRMEASMEGGWMDARCLHRDYVRCNMAGCCCTRYWRVVRVREGCE